MTLTTVKSSQRFGATKRPRQWCARARIRKEDAKRFGAMSAQTRGTTRLFDRVVCWSRIYR